MRIDCDECAMQHTDTCNDCVVAVLLRESDGPLEIDTAEAVALSAMADAGRSTRELDAAGRFRQAQISDGGVDPGNSPLVGGPHRRVLEVQVALNELDASDA